MVRDFTYDALPGRIVFGVGAARSLLKPEIERLEAQRILLIATRRESRRAAALAQPVGDRMVGVYSDVRPHVPIEVAEIARRTAVELGADCLLAIGGGSTVGMAKAIALETGLPIVAVPTTYAGSEVTPVYGLTSDGQKRTGRSLRVLPKVVIYDPELTLSLPPSITGPSAINAMAHCVEAFYAPGANPVTSVLAEEGIRVLARGVRRATSSPQDIEGRSETLYGAYLGGACFAVTGSGLHHRICHVLGGAYDLPHADLHTVVLPQAVAFNEPAIPQAMEHVRRALGDVEEGKDAARSLYDLVREIGAPTSLQEIGMKEENVDQAVLLVLGRVGDQNPRPVDESGIRAILQSAFAGRRPT